ncbi:F-box protein At1g11270-like [Salvia miltiorrhiza]|uniref:F-box protein At1g11270-like n=1 Tax=Salvia miltiorrhiza TaxID=226208 RepID=UPI0025ABA604|nr:F-box protein At1g11270-like [Salvia miltiorrhiza]
MDGIQNYLPHDVIEGILSRLPVKSLLRFKCVCKQWSATISAPKFAQTHLRRSKNSSSTILLVDLENSPEKAQLVDLETEQFRHSAVDYPVEVSVADVMCHCDGLYVLWCSDRGYALWNPSRRSYKMLNYQQYRFDHDQLMCGICYDPLVEDYNVVMADSTHYAVFHCRRNCWSDLKELNLSITIRYDVDDASGLPLKNGSIYWLRCVWGEGEVLRYEIVYFDGRDEEMKILCKADGDSFPVRMISSGECLRFFARDWDDQWVEMAMPPAAAAPAMPFGGGYAPLCWTHDGGKILLESSKDNSLQIYDVSEKSLARVGYPWNVLILHEHRPRLFPHVENVFWD